jgi:demethylmenaquinone methyltransferase/2-methoxy-6-polyprenyl-1,4-benzoquinol methylase
MSSPEPRTPEAQPEPKAPPHPTLKAYYAADPERSRYVLELFDETARHYNTVEKIFGNGGLLYRRLSLQRAGLRPGMRVLDVAIGTAAVSRGAVRLVGPGGRVFGVDPSMGMMREARKVFSGPLTRGVAQSLPFRSNEFDFVTMGIALRHVSDLVAAFSEYHRVLKPGGKVWILEGHVPASKLGHALTRFAWKTVIPGLTLAFTRDRRAKELMDYYWDTVEQCVPPEQILEAMRKAGFESPRFRVIVPGAFCEYTASKTA